MAEPLTINVRQAAAAAPAVYVVPGAVEVEPLSAFAHFDGSAAASAFLPSLAFYSASGLLVARTFPSNSVAAGGTADVSYFPGVGGSDNSISPPSGVIAEVTLTAPANVIDTGANAIPPGYLGIHIYTNLRTDEVAGGDGVNGGRLMPVYCTVNGDVGPNYDMNYLVYGGFATFGYGSQLAFNAWEMTAHGSGGPSTYTALNDFSVVNYSGPFWKSFTYLTGSPDPSNPLDNEVVIKALGWRSTAAIHQVTLTAQVGANFVAGSQLLVYGF